MTNFLFIITQMIVGMGLVYVFVFSDFPEEAAICIIFVAMANGFVGFALGLSTEKSQPLTAAPQGPLDPHTCLGCGGPADNGHDRCLPPNAYYCTKCEGKQ